jgi:hypothetical protein
MKFLISSKSAIVSALAFSTILIVLVSADANESFIHIVRASYG